MSDNTTAIWTNPGFRHDASFFLEVDSSNPGGDPENEGSPHVFTDDNIGFMTDVSLKSRLRAYWALLGHEVLMRTDVLNDQFEAVYKELGLPLKGKGKPNPKGDVAAGMRALKAKFLDVRMHGAVATTGHASCGKITGPFQVATGFSTDPITVEDPQITRKSITTQEKKEDQGTMGRKPFVRYGIYRFNIFYSPNENLDGALTAEDIKLFWDALRRHHEVTRSAARTGIRPIGLYIWTHEGRFGRWKDSSYSINDMLTPHLRPGIEQPSQITDYKVWADDTPLPQGVHLTKLIDMEDVIARAARVPGRMS